MTGTSHLITLNGVVIGQRTVGENNCFLDILTDKLGLIEVTSHGAKKLGSKNAGISSLYTYSQFTLSKNKGRYTINSGEPICSFHNLSSSIEALSLAVYFSEVIRYCTTSEEDHSDILRFVCMTFFQLAKGKLALDFIKAVFEFRFITHIGFMPDLRACRECACYQSDEMYFLPKTGSIICSDCYEESPSSYEDYIFLMTPTVLHTLRYVAYSDVNKMYSFTISQQSLNVFGAISEYYLLTQLGRGFDTLTYYKSITAFTKKKK